jgi:hypothetical protein
MQGRWSVRAGMLLFQGVVVSMLLGSAAATYLVVDRINYYAQRAYLASEQLRTVTLQCCEKHNVRCYL